MTIDVRPEAEPVAPSVGPRERYAAADGTAQLTGIQALVRLPLEVHRADRRSGLRTGAYISGYEGSPLAGYDLELARNREILAAHDVVATPGLNEEIALTAVEGTQLAAGTGELTRDGVVGWWYGKAPGLDRATDALRHANLAGTHRLGGAVALVGDDPAAKSSSVPCASEAALADMAVPVLYPADVQDVLDLGRHAVALSRASGCWVGLKIVTAVADASQTVALGADRVTPVEPDRTIEGREFCHEPTARLLQPYLGPLERDLYRARLEIARRYAAANGLNRILGSPTAKIGIVAAGTPWFDVRQALSQLGVGDDDVRLLRVGMPWPLEPGIVDRFADGLDEIVVVEEKRAFLETQIKERLYGRPGAPAVVGKSDPSGAELFAAHGALDVDTVAAGLARRLRAHGLQIAAPGRKRIDLPLAVSRTPFYCSGCPHNTSTTGAPEGSLVGAGIGCHTMVLLMPDGQVGEVTGITQMGGEGAHWLGMAPFVDADHWVQNMGDGTFHHSGSLAIRAAVAAGSHITFRLLHNGAAAMTGGQDAVGALSMPDLTRSLAAEGVARILVTTEDTRRYRGVRLAKGVEVWSRDRVDEAQSLLAATDGVTVLIHDQECAAQKRRKRKRGTLETPAVRVVINERICEGCGDCGQKSNCLSVTPVDTEFSRKTRIHQGSCNLDYSCLEGDCPAFTVVSDAPSLTTAFRKATSSPAPTPQLPPVPDLPEPSPAVERDGFTMRIAGIGGTGVTTVAQVLAAAFRLDGRHVRGLDQTGLAQKGGAVVSDLTVTDAPAERASRAARDSCDLYLGADLLVAADPATLAVAAVGRTVAVVSSGKTPTGEMVVDPSVGFPAVDAVLGRIRAVTRRDAGAVLDARALSEALFGERGGDQYALTLLLGAAFQTGALPVSAAAVEEAFALNGAAVAANVEAFRRGRQAVADPDGFAALFAPDPDTSVPGLSARGAAQAAEIVASIGAPAGSELARLVGVRVPELVAYQDAAYARSYASVVASLVSGSSRLAEAVAIGLHKLMAYKDEYEVARLALDPAFAASVAARHGDGARVSWKLHPPVLRAMGLRRKLTLGPWFRPSFRALRAMRRLRGTALDPFGRAHVRAVERALVDEYVALVGRLAVSDDVDLAVEIASLPDMVRGYEEVKLASVTAYREKLASLLPAV